MRGRIHISIPNPRCSVHLHLLSPVPGNQQLPNACCSIGPTTEYPDLDHSLQRRSQATEAGAPIKWGPPAIPCQEAPTAKRGATLRRNLTPVPHKYHDSFVTLYLEPHSHIPIEEPDSLSTHSESYIIYLLYATHRIENLKSFELPVL